VTVTQDTSDQHTKVYDKHTNPPLHDNMKFWTYNVQATVKETNTSTYSMKQNSPLAAGEEIPYL
jgi:hypothetical protein